MPPDSSFFDEEGYFDAGYKVYIGPGKYFVTSDVGSGRIQWYAFLALPPGMSLSPMHPNSDHHHDDYTNLIILFRLIIIYLHLSAL